MTRKILSISSQTQVIESPSEEIIQESLRWVNMNKGHLLNPNNSDYQSPRISSEIMDCSMPMTFDQYSNCSLGCLYCFASFFKSNNPAIKEMALKAISVRSIENAIDGRGTDARSKLFHKHFYSKRFLLHWGGMADPFCNYEKTNNIGCDLLRVLGDRAYPTLLSFKGNALFGEKYLELLRDYSRQKNFAFQVSMVTADPKMSAKVEIGVPAPTLRLKALKTLSDMGYWTILRLRPFIIGITDESLDDLLNMALDAGISAISTEFFALDGRANIGMKTRYDWLAKIIGVDNLMKYFKALSPSERGGYMRLNRMVKEQYVRKIYNFCVENNLVLGISDPDFKELNMSGSCCAMPDVYPENPELCNWSKDQLTYALKEARKQYHRRSIISMGQENPECLTFNKTFQGDVSYLDDIGLTNDHVSAARMSNVDRHQKTFRTILRAHWNNLRSPANPRNYLHGKIMPIGVDQHDDLLYKYTCSEYEDRWVKEGIDLSIR
jgi:DNA repair photolyase